MCQLVRRNGVHCLIVHMHGVPVYLERVHVETKPRSFGIPKVLMVRAFGSKVETGEPTYVDCRP